MQIPAGHPWAAYDRRYTPRDGLSRHHLPAGLPMYLDEMIPLSPVHEPSLALQPIVVELIGLTVPAFISLLPHLEATMRLEFQGDESEPGAFRDHWTEAGEVFRPEIEGGPGESGEA